MSPKIKTVLVLSTIAIVALFFHNYYKKTLEASNAIRISDSLQVEVLRLNTKYDSLKLLKNSADSIIEYRSGEVIKTKAGFRPSAKLTNPNAIDIYLRNFIEE